MGEPNVYIWKKNRGLKSPIGKKNYVGIKWLTNLKKKKIHYLLGFNF